MASDSFQLVNVQTDTKDALLTRTENYTSNSSQDTAAPVELATRDERAKSIQFWVCFIIGGLALIQFMATLIRHWW